MVQHLEATSESEEMYLITIATAVEDGHPEPVPVSLLAERLAVSSVSANQMVRKLASRGYVAYEPYRGVSLTPSGRSVAASILRSRRLWGVFLSDRLGLGAGRADAVACDLEHVTPDDVADLLCEFLGDPMAGPRGRAIPSGDGTASPVQVETLADVPAGDHRTVGSIRLAAPIVAFLEEEGLTPGVDIEILGVGSRGNRLVSIGGECLDLGAEITGGILLEPS